MNHQPLIKASVQDVVKIQEFRAIEVPSKENKNKWEKELCGKGTQRIGNMRKKGLQGEISDFSPPPVHWRQMVTLQLTVAKRAHETIHRQLNAERWVV